jgi:flagellar biogenesis protein FliO
MASALTGVLLLGVGGVLLLRRLRQGKGALHGAALIGLRQTLRLSAKQAIHAIEFDERILLVGEGDKGLTLLETGRLPERAADEAEVASRTTDPAGATTMAEAADDGAVPRNLVIPRPAQALPRRLPTPATTPATRKAENPALADFRNLLQKAGRS